jgi:hypothetical protein
MRLYPVRPSKHHGLGLSCLFGRRIAGAPADFFGHLIAKTSILIVD